jgi:hypothetical protein
MCQNLEIRFLLFYCLFMLVFFSIFIIFCLFVFQIFYCISPFFYLVFYCPSFSPLFSLSFFFALVDFISRLPPISLGLKLVVVV